MAHPIGSEPPDSAAQDMAAIALAIAVLLIIVILASWLPAAKRDYNGAALSTAPPARSEEIR